MNKTVLQTPADVIHGPIRLNQLLQGDVITRILGLIKIRYQMTKYVRNIFNVNWGTLTSLVAGARAVVILVTRPSTWLIMESLDLMHEILLFCTGKIVHAPLEKRKAQHVLDLGTGTGVWAVDFAQEYPDTQVLGIDLRYSSLRILKGAHQLTRSLISPVRPAWYVPTPPLDASSIRSEADIKLSDPPQDSFQLVSTAPTCSLPYSCA